MRTRPPAPAAAPDLTRQLKSLTDLLRLAHVRHRFAAETDRAAAAKSQDEPDSGEHNDGKYHYKVDMPWNDKWTDQPHVVASIVANPDRLKSYMLLLTINGRPGYEPFLAAFPDDLARARKAAQAPSPNPTPV